MIFSKFFKPAWQSKDVNTRIAAVNDELNTSNNEDLIILNQLLANDNNELVRRAVLLKLNSFEHWLKASTDNSNKKIREYAQQQVEAIVLEQHEIKLSSSEKTKFLASSNKTSLLEAWLNNEQNSELALSIFKKLAKPQLLPSVFAHKQQADFQLKLLEEVNSIEMLERLSKKSRIAEVNQAINEKIAKITEQQQKPGKVTKQTQLILAKLLALKDISQYAEMLARKAKIIDDWQQVSSEFNYLSDRQRQEFIDKYQTINQQLEKIFAPKAEAFEQQKIVEHLEKQRITQADTIDRQIKESEQTLSNSIFEHNSIDETAFNQAIELITQHIVDSVLDEKQKSNYLAQCQQLQRRLQQLPVIAESVTDATHLISKISQLALPQKLAELNEKESQYLTWCKNFNQVKDKADGALPDSIVQAYQEIVKQWQQALKPLQQAQQKHFSQTQRKLSDVKRLIHSGKFNAAFGVFKKAQHLYQSLNEKQQTRLQRDYQFAQEKISELSDWEHYIATPRKQELLAQVKQLVEQPCDNPVDQAAQVKKYRKQWNLLGHAEDDQEQALNEEFNQLSEQAFAPCRLYYAEQEKLRDQHLVVRENIIKQVRDFNLQLSVDNVNWKAFDAKLNQFKQQWRDAGEVERTKYQALNSEFHGLLKPAKTALYQHYQKNVGDKQALITKANQQLSNSDITDAAAQLKQLQQQWRDIGYCGPKQENKLWQEFRAINDQVFQRRATIYEDQKQELAELEHGYFNDLEKIVADSELAKTAEHLTQSLSHLHALQETVAQSDNHFKAINNSINQQIKQVESKLAKQKKLAKQQVFECLFDTLSQMAGQEVDNTAFSSLPKNWQKRVNNMPAADADHQLRHQQTIALEILAGVESPKADQQQRLSLQVQLMQDQMTSGQNINLEQTFIDWLMLGQLTEQDLPLLNRIKPILMANI